MKSTARLFNRHFVLLFFSLLALCFCHGMVCIELPLYLTDAGYGTTAAGYLTAAFAIVAMLSRVFGGHLTDRFPKTAVVAAGCVLYGLGCALFPVFSGVGFLLLCRMLNGAGFSAATTASCLSSLAHFRCMTARIIAVMPEPVTALKMICASSMLPSPFCLYGSPSP